jgi:predicted MFS family arabinose efflux permease
VLGPALNEVIGVPGIFSLTGVLALAAIAVVRWVVPDPQVSRPHADAGTIPGQISAVLRNVELQRLNFGIFSLHAAMRGLFVVIPPVLAGSLALGQHWKVYLPIMLVSFFAAVPAIILAEKYGRMKLVFCSAVGLLCLAMLAMAVFIGHFTGLVVTLFLFFLAFNLLEATLPSLVSKIAPAVSKGTAIGVYNGFQFLGLFIGGALGGFLAQHVGSSAVLVFSSGLALAWLMLAVSMRAPLPVRTRLLHVGVMDRTRARRLSQNLALLTGVVEAVVIASEGVAYLKVRTDAWDEDGAHQLIKEGV